MAMTCTEIFENPDHRVWAREFCRIAREKGFDPASTDDEDWVGTWIANAMMHGVDRTTGQMAVNRFCREHDVDLGCVG